MNLTKNFTLLEMTKSETASRKGIDNTPNDYVIQNLQTLCENVLQPIRDTLGAIHVSSGYRSSELNSAVGGSKTSDHCLGMAADIEIPGMSNYDLASYIVDNLEYTQVILEFYTPGIPNSGWVHVSYNPNNLKREYLTAINNNGRVIYKRGLIE